MGREVPPASRETGTRVGLFVDDLRRTMQVLARVRWLVPAAVVVGLAAAGVAALGRTPAGVVLVLLGPAWLVVWCGWLGTERVVVARAARGEELHVRNVWASVQVLGPRFVRLGLALLPVGIALVVAGAALRAPSLGYRAVLAPVLLVTYALLTFVAPALVFTTARVRDAVPIGWRLLRTTVGETWAHALVPAGAVAALVLVGGGSLLWVPVLEAAALLVRGATALRYVELVDVAWRDVPGGVWRRRVGVGAGARPGRARR